MKNKELETLEKEFEILKSENARLKEEISSSTNSGNEKFRNFVEQSYEGIIIINSSGDVIEWNPAIEKMTGISKPEACKAKIWENAEKIFTSKSKNSSPSYKEKIKSLLQNENKDKFNQIIESRIKKRRGKFKRHIYK